MNDSHHRRAFLFHVAAGGAALLAAPPARAQPAMLSESDPTAAALGYTAQTQRVDARRFPRHSASQRCGVCQLYTGRTRGEPVGGCGIFPGRLVPASGWCSAFVP